MRIEVTAAPCSDERRTRRSELPSVRPKPRSSGSATKVARRRLSPPPIFFSSVLGFFISCQFFALTAIFFLFKLKTIGDGFGFFEPAPRVRDDEILYRRSAKA